MPDPIAERPHLAIAVQIDGWGAAFVGGVDPDAAAEAGSEIAIVEIDQITIIGQDEAAAGGVAGVDGEAAGDDIASTIDRGEAQAGDDVGVEAGILPIEQIGIQAAASAIKAAYRINIEMNSPAFETNFRECP
ncbi:MAG: hypothetical protein WCO82_09055 [Sphingomonadales bacterium]